MTVQMLTVTEDEGEQRLDKWFKRRFPQISQGHVEKMCRTGQVRIDSARAKASDRVIPGQTVRVPPLPDVELTRQITYQLLLGEVAAQRGELGLSASAYMDLAQSTRDPRIAKRRRMPAALWFISAPRAWREM